MKKLFSIFIIGALLNAAPTTHADQLPVKLKYNLTSAYCESTQAWLDSKTNSTNGAKFRKDCIELAKSYYKQYQSNTALTSFKSKYLAIDQAAAQAGLSLPSFDDASNISSKTKSNSASSKEFYVDADGNLTEKKNKDGEKQKKSISSKYTDGLTEAQKEAADKMYQSDDYIGDELRKRAQNFQKSGTADGKYNEKFTKDDGVVDSEGNLQARDKDSKHGLSGNLTDASGNNLKLNSDKTLEENREDFKAAKQDARADCRKSGFDENSDACKNYYANRAAQRQTGKMARTAKHDEKLDAQAADIMTKNTTGQYGGKYGGASKETTQAINTGADYVRNTSEQVLSRITERNNTAETAALNSKGFSATQADAIQTQVKSIQNSADSLSKQALVTNVVGGIQTLRGLQHQFSRSAVNKTARRAMKITDKMMKCDSNSPGCAAQQQQAVDAQTNIKDNATGEKKAQTEAMAMQAVTAAQTLYQAQQIKAERKAALDQADMLNAMAAQTTGGTFAYNPGTGGVTDPGGNPDNNPNIDNQVVTTGPEAGIDTSGDGPINTDAGDGGVAGPAADKFNAMDPSKNGGGSGAPLNMQGGSTSAANDAKGGDQVAPGKAQAGGQYAAGDNAGVGSRFSAGSKGPAVDTSFMDMMKNLLGGEDKGNHQGVEAMVERSVASDQPSVLSRNKNLFQEISKSYQKKSSEGAIVFSGDRS